MVRETIYAALFSTVSGAANFTTKTRRLQHWSDVDSNFMPYLAQIQVKESAEQKKGVPVKWTLHAEIYLYVSTEASQDPSIVPSSLLNPLVDAIETALAPTPGPGGGTQTLGGKVSHCWISGAVEIFEGLLGDKAVAIIPIEILPPT